MFATLIINLYGQIEHVLSDYAAVENVGDTDHKYASQKKAEGCPQILARKESSCKESRI